MISPGPPPPQAQRAFVKQLLSLRRPGGPDVAATVRDDGVVELVNEGEQTAGDLRVLFAGGRVDVGNLPAGETAEARVPVEAGDRLVWVCRNRRGRQYLWSYDWRHARRSRRIALDDAAAFALFFPRA